MILKCEYSFIEKVHTLFESNDRLFSYIDICALFIYSN